MPETPATPTVSLGSKKRDQIKSTGRNIFLWLAVSSVIVSICAVATQFLVKELLFNNEIISIKSATNKQLITNIDEAGKLKQSVNELLADDGLASVETNAAPDAQSSSLKVVLDALPVQGDATTFANSLQTVILQKSGVGILELGTTSGEGEAAAESAPVVETSKTPLTLTFKAGFSGDYAKTQQAFKDIARTIRPINITQLTIRTVDGGALMTDITGQTYYLPSKAIEVRKEVKKK